MKNILLLILLSPILSMCQPIKLKGKIINEQDEPVAGATIIVKRAAQLRINQNSQPIISDQNGEFQITGLLYTDTILISAVGYHTTMETFSENDRGYVIIVLKRNAKALQEVVINTGIQTLPRERATGSFSNVSNKLLEQQVSTDILSRLEAVANSIVVDRKTIGGGIIIRGLSTINGPKAPLIILDNFPYEGDLNNINPNDIKDITILKDAAAASIWGTRAGNGVIVITTKKAQLNQKFSLELNTNYTILDKPDLFYLPRISSSDYIDVEKFLFSKNYRFSDTLSSSKPPFSPVYEILFRQRRGLLSAAEADAQLDALRMEDIRRQYKQLVYDKGLNQQYAINMMGGSSNMAWTIFMGHDRNKSQLNNRYERYNIRLHNSYHPTSNITITASLTGTSSNAKSGKSGLYQERTDKGEFQPYLSFLDNNGKEMGIYKDYRQTFLDTLGMGKLLDWKYYPLSDYQHDYVQTNSLHLLGMFGFNMKLFRSLSLDVKYQYENQVSNSDRNADINSYFTRNLVNTYTQPDYTNQSINYIVPRGGILDKSSARRASQNFRASAYFNKEWQNHSLTLLAGSENRQLISVGNTYRIFGLNPQILTYGKVDFNTSYPSIINGRNTFIPDNSSLFEVVNRYASFFSNAAYTFKNRYTITASARRDASNLFGVRTNDKWNPFWSAGIGWNISSENFWKLNAIPYLRLRSTYGYSGNIDPSKVASTTIRYFSTVSSFTQSPYAQFDNFANPELRWERIATLNFGIDFRSRDNIISGSIEYYRKKGTDLFGPAPLDYTSGLRLRTIEKNVASMKAQGWDFEINTFNLRGEFEWNSRFNFSIYNDEVTDYHLSSYHSSYFLTPGQAATPVKGYPVYGVFSYNWAGLDPQSGDPQGYINGQESKDYTSLTDVDVFDLAFNGRLMPKFFGSLGNQFSWNHIELNVALTYKFGYVFRRNTIHYGSLIAGNNFHGDYALRWQKPGDESITQVPSFIYPVSSSRDNFYNGSDILVEKGDHIRLNYISVAYSLERSHIKRLPVKAIKLYFNMNNCGILWKANELGIDPDYIGNNLPEPRNYAFGCKISL